MKCSDDNLRWCPPSWLTCAHQNWLQLRRHFISHITKGRIHKQTCDRESYWLHNQCAHLIQNELISINLSHSYFTFLQLKTDATVQEREKCCHTFFYAGASSCKINGFQRLSTQFSFKQKMVGCGGAYWLALVSSVI